VLDEAEKHVFIVNHFKNLFRSNGGCEIGAGLNWRLKGTGN
jgi:hypothetical protein